MSRVATFILFTICLLYSSITMAKNSNKAYDIRQFDIAGVKLGMTEAEAKKALKEKLSIDVKSFKYGLSLINRVTKTRLPSYFRVKINGIDITFSLRVKLPVDEKNTMVISSIRYKSNGTVEPKDMRQQAINKYGIPTKGSADEPGHFPAAWCVPPSKTASCAVAKAYLTLKSGELFLYDHSYADAEIAFIKKSKKAKPVF